MKSEPISTYGEPAQARSSRSGTSWSGTRLKPMWPLLKPFRALPKAFGTFMSVLAGAFGRS